MKGHLRLAFSPAFSRDIKKISAKRTWDPAMLEPIFDLIAENSNESLQVLKQRHNMHKLVGDWKGRYECHVANIGDWLLVWRVEDGYAFIERTGTHDDIYKH